MIPRAGWPSLTLPAQTARSGAGPGAHGAGSVRDGREARSRPKHPAGDLVRVSDAAVGADVGHGISHKGTVSLRYESIQRS